MRNTAPTAYTAVPTVVTTTIGHVHRNQWSHCRNPFGHLHRNLGHDPGIAGHDRPEYPEAGLPVPEMCRELGISTATFYKWRAKFGGMDTSMMTRMKELEDENRRLRKMYLEEKLKSEIANEYLAKK